MQTALQIDVSFLVIPPTFFVLQHLQSPTAYLFQPRAEQPDDHRGGAFPLLHTSVFCTYLHMSPTDLLSEAAHDIILISIPQISSNYRMKSLPMSCLSIVCSQWIFNSYFSSFSFQILFSPHNESGTIICWLIGSWLTASKYSCFPDFFFPAKFRVLDALFLLGEHARK